MAIVGILAVAIFALYAQELAHRRRERASERREAAWLEERRQLLNRLMYMANHTWEEPPPPIMPDRDETLYLPTEIIDPLSEPV